MTTARLSRPLPGWTGPILALALLAAAVPGVLSLRTPPPRHASAPDTVFSARRAWPDLARLAALPRPVGSPAHAEAREHLVASLRALGLEVEARERLATPAGWWSVRAVPVRNIVARLPGRAPTGTVALVSHYDSHLGAPGAGDAGVAVAAILEAVRAVQAGPPLRNDLLVLLTDAEELGLIGARAFLDADTADALPMVVLNFEGRGTRGPALMFETGRGNGPLIRALAGAAPRPVASSLFPEAYRFLPNITDFAAFLEAGRTGLNFAHIGGAAAYHTPLDTPDRVDPGTLQHHGDQALALARHLGQADLATLRGPDLTYFTLPGVGLVHYPSDLALPLALAALLGLVTLAAWGLLRRAFGPGALAAGAGALIAAAGIAALAGWGIWRAAAAAHPEAGTLIGQQLYREGAYLGAVLGVAAAATFGAFLLLARPFAAAGLALGAQVVAVGIAIAAAAIAPGAAYLFTWPAIFALAGAGWLIGRRRRPHARRDAAVLLALAVPPIVLAGGHLPLFLAGLSIRCAALFGVLAVLFAAALLPLLPALARPNRWWLPAAAGTGGAVFLLAGLTGAGPTPDRPAAAHLVYLLDRDSVAARWASPQPPGDRWLDAVLGPGTEDRVDVAGFIPIYGSRAYRTAQAPVADLEPTRVSVIEEGASDRVRLRIEPPDDALVVLLFPADTGWVPVRLEAKPLYLHPAEWRAELWGRPAHGSWTVELVAATGAAGAGGVRVVTIRDGLPSAAEALPARPADRAGTGVWNGRTAFSDLSITRQTWRPSRSRPGGGPRQRGAGPGPDRRAPGLAR